MDYVKRLTFGFFHVLTTTCLEKLCNCPYENYWLPHENYQNMKEH